MNEEKPRIACQICGQEKSLSDVIPAELVRDSIVDLIRREYPNWD